MTSRSGSRPDSSPAIPGPVSRTRRLLANELLKFRAQWWVWIVVVLPATVALLLPVAIGFEERVGSLEGVGDDIPVGGYHCLAVTLHQALYLGSFALFLYALQAIAGERTHGHLRDTVAGPVRRHELVIAKWLGLVAILLALFVVVVAGAAVSTSFLFEYGDVLEEGVPLVESGELFGETVRALYLFLPPCLTLVCLGLFVSSLSSNPGLAAALGIVTMSVLEVSKGLLSSGPRYRYYLFNDWLPSPFQGDSYLGGLRKFAEGFSDALWSLEGPEYRLNLVVPLAQAAVLLGATLVVVARKDVTE